MQTRIKKRMPGRLYVKSEIEKLTICALGESLVDLLVELQGRRVITATSMATGHHEMPFDFAWLDDGRFFKIVERLLVYFRLDVVRSEPGYDVQARW